MSFTMVIFEDFLPAKCEVKLNPKLSPRFWFFSFFAHLGGKVVKHLLTKGDQTTFPK
jgi:hypothetical protein